MERKARPRRPNSMASLMRRCLPTDRLFSIDELLRLMQDAEPGRTIKPLSARTQFHQFEREGILRRVMRSEGRCYLWAAQGYEAPPVTPLANKYLYQVVADVLDELGPLKAFQITVTLQVRGYRAAADPRQLHKTVRDCLHAHRDLFWWDWETRRWAVL